METKNLINLPENGVYFDNQKDTAIIRIENCDKSAYIETIKNLLRYVSMADDDCLGQNERWVVCNLIESMLPSPKQIHNESEVFSGEQMSSVSVLVEAQRDTIKGLKEQIAVMQDRLDERK